MSNQLSHNDVLCFGGGDWWYHNHGHADMQLMKRFAKQRTTVYINSVVMQKPKLSHGRRFIKKLLRKTKSIFSGLKKSNAGFWVYSPFSLPVHHILRLAALNERLVRFQVRHIVRRLRINRPVIWVVCPAACDMALQMEKHKLVYLRTDRYEEYPNVDREMVCTYDRRLKVEADITVFVNQHLFEQERKSCKKAIYLDHGVDFEMFASAEDDKNVPEDMANTPRPIVGFFGGIDDHTFDVEFAKNVVDLLTHMSFVFVGNVSANCDGLMSKKNVWMLGQKAYEQIPHYGKCFDVAIMPWRQNRWIEGCNPIKLKEYLALGKPTVSTPFPELRKYRDVIYQAKTASDFADCIREAIKHNDLKRIAKRRKRVESSSWDSRAEQVLQALFDKA